MKIPFITQSYLHRSTNVAFLECVNYYPEIQPPEAKEQLVLVGTPGLDAFVSYSTTNAGRGVYTPAGSQANKIYAVVGSTLYRVYTNGSSEVTLGTFASGGRRQVYFADCGTSQSNEHLLVVADGRSYYVDMSAESLTDITSTMPSSYPTHCVFLDGRFIVNDLNSLTCYYSSAYDASSWSASDAFTVESTGDNCNGLIVHDGNIWAFGQNSFEVFYNTGSTPLFARISGTPGDVGLLAPDSLSYDGKQIYYVGANRYGTAGVYTSEGFSVRPISTPAINYLLTKGTNLEEAIGFCYSQEGHNFYQLTIPDDNITYVYDSTTNMWHRRTYLNNGSEDRHRANKGVNVNSPTHGQYVVLQDYETGQLYKYNLDTYTDNGAEIKRTKTTSCIHQNRQRLSFSSFQLDMETGIGLQTGQGSDPKGIIQISNDGGHTWGNEIEVGLGKVGKYTHRVKINRLGQAYDRVFRFYSTDPVKQVLIGGYAEAKLNG